MRTLHADLTTAQMGKVVVPYVELKIKKGITSSTVYTYTTADTRNRIRTWRHIEEPYNDYAVLVLENSDLSLPSFFGYYIEVYYGCITSSGIRTSQSAPLWVKGEFHNSRMGDLDKVLLLEGAWNVLKEYEDIASFIAAPVAPYKEIDYSGSSYTIYDIIKAVLASAGFSLLPLGSHNDNIIDTLTPDFVVNQAPFENAQIVLYRLLNMTRCFLRAEAPAGITGEDKSVATVNDDGDLDNNSLAREGTARFCFYAKLRFWVFWSTDGHNFDYSTSQDGITWTTPITITSASSTDQTVFFDGTYAHTAYSDQDNGGDYRIWYRRGLPNADGTITWSAAAQLAKSDDDSFTKIVISCDSEGYAWIAYKWNRTSANYPYVMKNANRDGTWSTGTNKRIKEEHQSNWTMSPIPMQGGRVYTVCCYLPGNPAYGMLYDPDTGFGSLEDIDDTVSSGLSGTAIGDDVHIAYHNGSDIQYRIRDYDTATWGDEYDFGEGQALGWPSVSRDGAGNTFTSFFREVSGDWKLYYKKWNVVDESWDATVEWYVEADVVRRQSLSTSWSGHMGGQLIAVWTWGDGGTYPWEVHFISLGVQGDELATFRVICPGTYALDYYYKSDRPDDASHQFREFEWRDHLQIPNHVYSFCNKDEESETPWANLITGEWIDEDSIAEMSREMTQFHIAGTLDNQTDANNRAEAYAQRQWMEEDLGVLKAIHNCGQELYDWVRISDKRGATSYTLYPNTRWSWKGVVGSIQHIYQQGKYDIEITFNGIDSSRPIDRTVPRNPQEVFDEVSAAQKDIMEAAGRIGALEGYWAGGGAGGGAGFTAQGLPPPVPAPRPPQYYYEEDPSDPRYGRYLEQVSDRPRPRGRGGFPSPFELVDIMLRSLLEKEQWYEERRR